MTESDEPELELPDTVKGANAWLAVLFASLAYTAVRVSFPADDGVYDTEHLPDERAHDAGENPPPAEAVQLTIPVGDVPFTVAVQVTPEPTFADGEAHVAAVVDVFGGSSTETSFPPRSLM
jgi:hypothetical protein